MGVPEPSVEQLLTIVVDTDGPVAIVTPAGELDLATAPGLNAAISGVRADAPLVLDLSALTFADSSGLALFVKHAREALQADRAFVFVRPPNVVARVIELSGLERLLTLTDDLPAALTAAQRGAGA